MGKGLIIAIDGPAGSGKSTVAKIVAARIGLLYIDTGAMYRALTLKALRGNVDLTDKNALVDLARAADIKLVDGKAGPLKVLLDGVDVSAEIRTQEVTANVRHIAGVPDVRHRMVELQREMSRAEGAVLEGRDIGTVVFPDADRKFYLDASVEVRAGRRYKEFIEKGFKASLDDVKRDVERRDYSDKTREVGPLKMAEDGILIDTSGLGIEEVVTAIIEYVRVP